jgi:hypothetical protein
MTYDNDFSISPDGRQFAASRQIEGIRYWPPLNDVLSVIDKELAFGDRATCVFDAQDGSEVARLPASYQNLFSPDGKSFALVATTEDVAIYDAPFDKPHGQRIAISFVVGVVVFPFLFLIESSVFRAAQQVFSRSVHVPQLFKRPRVPQGAECAPRN